MNQRRNILKGIAVTTAALTSLPEQWSKPLINAVILPAHAQTSCSGFTTTTVNESLTLTVTDTTVSGPTDATRTGNTFDQTDTLDLASCRDGNTSNITVEFNGTIDPVTNSISGNINIVQTCGSDFVCEQISTFEVTQSPATTSENGNYEGTLNGTLRCCDDF